MNYSDMRRVRKSMLRSLIKKSGPILLLLAAIGSGYGQKFGTDKGEIKFTSNAELELISAQSKEVQGKINTQTRSFAFLVKPQSFVGFNSDLQRKHFNDNYLESDKFPAIKFSGKIIEEVVLTQPGTYEVRAKGELEVHGQKQMRIIKAKVISNGRDLQIEARFVVPLTDHQITIPKIVSQKIATEINVEFRATLVQEQ